ncbi:hypothetical protein GCM10027614_20040 [Micromonospora vulcania]
MYRPIAAHGAANAALMTAAGLAETARDPAALVACVRTRLVGRPPARLVEVPPEPFLPYLGLPALADRRPPAEAEVPAGSRPGGRAPGGRPPSWPLRAQDAFFVHVQSPTVAQQIGTVLDLDPRPDGRPLTRADLTALLARRLPAIATLRRRLVSRGRWRRPGWVVDRQADAAAHVDEVRVGPDDDGGAAVDRFWSDPLALDRPPWRMLLVSGLPDGRTRVAVKLHHCLGDGLSAIGVLQRLMDPGDRTPSRSAAPATAVPTVAPADDRAGAAVGAGRAPTPGGVQRGRPGERARELARQARLTARGLARLATQGPAPRSPLNRPLSSPRRRLFTASLPAAEVLRAARACGAHTSELMVALTAGALNRVHPAPAPPRLRAMFAVSTSPRRRAPTYGNWTGAVSLDLPLERAAARDRVTAVRGSLRAALASGEVEAAGLVMRAMGALPAPLHAAAARRVYTSRHLNVIVSYMPAPFRTHRLAGAPVRTATPVVALADGVPVGIGVLRCGPTFEIGVLLDESLADSGPALVAALRADLAELLADVDAATGRDAVSRSGNDGGEPAVGGDELGADVAASAGPAPPGYAGAPDRVGGPGHRRLVGHRGRVGTAAHPGRQPRPRRRPGPGPARPDRHRDRRDSAAGRPEPARRRRTAGRAGDGAVRPGGRAGQQRRSRLGGAVRHDAGRARRGGARGEPAGPGRVDPGAAARDVRPRWAPRLRRLDRGPAGSGRGSRVRGQQGRPGHLRAESPAGIGLPSGRRDGGRAGVVQTAFFERRGRPYHRDRPRAIPPDRVAAAVADAIVRNQAEVYLPAWLRVPVAVQGLLPAVYRRLASRFG